MQGATKFALVLLVVGALVGVSQSATRAAPPPLFREHPNARIESETADDDLDYRLPNATIPHHYDIHLETNVHNDGEKPFKGTVAIEIETLSNTTEVVLHARQLEITSAKIKQKDTTLEFSVQYVFEKEREFLTLTTPPLTEGTYWTLTIEYKGNLRTDNGGFYLSSYLDADNKRRYLATTQFESTDARHGFPCYDEPAKRATFTITIKHGADYHAISNMPVNETESTPGNTVFQTTKSMSTYLVAFIVSDFEYTEGVLNNLPQRIYSRPGTKHDQEWALLSGMQITERLGDYYGVPFAFPKLDQVAVPDFAAGAMENWGLVTYREEYMLYNKHTSTVNTQTNIANIIAHEYTHQWFGNLVAVRWWTYLWLKEGFATLFSWKATDDTYPEWDVFQMFHTDDYQRALNSDAGDVQRPMTHYVQKPSEISRLYDSISYSKAGCVLHMFNHALTDDIFKAGLNNYLTQNNFSSARENELFNAIQNAALEENYPIPYTVEVMMSSWTRQGGYPLLTVTRDYNSGGYTVRQEAFYNNKTNPTKKLWYVPFNHAVKSNPDFRNTTAAYWFHETEIAVTDAKISNEDWLLLNKQSTGYYRINYDERNWHLIIDGLIEKPHKIHPRNRAQLIHDSYRFSSSDRLPHSILLSLMTYLQKEDQYAPWSTANAIITVFNRYLGGSPGYDDFKFYIAQLVGPAYDKLGVNDIPGEQHLQKFTRNVVINIACLVGIEDCLKETNGKLNALLDEGVEIEPNLQSQTFCNGLRQATDKTYDFVFIQLGWTEDQAKRRMLISSLGCSQKENQLKKFIESSIDMDNGLRTQERTTLLSAAYSRGETGLLTSIDFLDKNWEAYGNLTSGTFGGNNPLDSDIRGMSQYVVNEVQEKKLKDLVTKVKGSAWVRPTLEEAVNNNIQDNFDWLEKNSEPLLLWMTKFRTGGSSAITASFLSVTLALVVTMTRIF